MTEVGGNEVKRTRQWHAALMEPLTFELLRGSVIDLENFHTAREGRLPQRKAVEAGANDDILPQASADGYLQRILSVSRTEDGPSIARVPLQGRV
jgi:hypothetical protein